VIKTQSAIEMDLTEIEKVKLWEFFPNGIISIDLETTGLSPLVDQIIEVGAIKITPHGSVIFQTLVNPLIPIPPHTTAIHNITDDMVKDSPTLKSVLEDLKQFVGDLPIIAHNAKFDLGFIVLGMQRLKIALVGNEIYCSCKLARHTHVEIINHKLSTLVKELNIPLENHHRATDDAFAAIKIFMNSLERIKTPLSPILNRYRYIFSLLEFEKYNSEELPENLASLEKLVKEAAVIEILYNGGNYKNQWRPLKLTSLLNTPEGNILYARCLWSNIQKSFKLKKITDLRLPSAEDIQKWLKKE
jgi:DNA polymerase III epsilon subunit family exonuclease